MDEQMHIVEALVNTVEDGKQLYLNNAIFHAGVMQIAQVAISAVRGLVPNAVKQQADIDAAVLVRRSQKISMESIIRSLEQP